MSERCYRPNDFPELAALLAVTESEIVWLERISNLDYVRETLVRWCRRRSGRIRWEDRFEGRTVGYSNLFPDAHRGDDRCFLRRVFWLKAHDRDRDPTGCYRADSGMVPSEAVDPRTVRPGVLGRRSRRCHWGPRRPTNRELLS